MLKKMLCGLLCCTLVSVSSPSFAQTPAPEKPAAVSTLNPGIAPQIFPQALDVDAPDMSTAEVVSLGILSYLVLTPALVHWSQGDLWGGVFNIVLTQLLAFLGGFIMGLMQFGDSYRVRNGEPARHFYMPVMYNIAVYGSYFLFALEPLGFLGALAYVGLGIGLVEGANQLGLYQTYLTEEGARKSPPKRPNTAPVKPQAPSELGVHQTVMRFQF